jgi:hypothetical protein
LQAKKTVASKPDDAMRLTMLQAQSRVAPGEDDGSPQKGRGYNEMLRRKTLAFAKALDESETMEVISPTKALQILNIQSPSPLR